MFETEDVPVVVSLDPKQVSNDIGNGSRPPSLSDMVGSIDPKCSRLADQAAHIDEGEVAVSVHLLYHPNPSCCHCLYRHSRMLCQSSATPRLTSEP